LFYRLNCARHRSDRIMAGDFARVIVFFVMAVIGSACAGGVKDAADPPAPSGADPTRP